MFFDTLIGWLAQTQHVFDILIGWVAQTQHVFDILIGCTAQTQYVFYVLIDWIAPILVFLHLKRVFCYTPAILEPTNRPASWSGRAPNQYQFL